MSNDTFFLQADLEEAKTQENTKLQTALQDMQLQFKETKDLLMKERETVKKVVESVPVIQEVAVVDHELTNKLSSENEKLKVRLLNFHGSLLYTMWLIAVLETRSLIYNIRL